MGFNVFNLKKANSLINNWFSIESIIKNIRIAQRSSRVVICVPSFYLLQTYSLLVECPYNVLCGVNDFSGFGLLNEETPSILRDLGCKYVLLRDFQQPPSWNCNCIDKLKLLIANGILPIIVVGETYGESKSNVGVEVLSMQIRLVSSIFNSLFDKRPNDKVLIVYKPIGTSCQLRPLNIRKAYSVVAEGSGVEHVLYGGNISRARRSEVYGAGFSGLLLDIN